MKNTIWNDAINNLSIPLEEVNFNATDYVAFLKDQHFHHSDKGCKVKMLEYRPDRGVVIIKKCLTHNVICSKTGWEKGWYLGTNTKKICNLEKIKKICIKCGRVFLTCNITNHKCSHCKKYV